MTTICYKNGILVADSCVTMSMSEMMHHSWPNKKPKIVSDGEFLFGAVGVIDLAQEFLKWAVAGCDPDTFPKAENEKFSFEGFQVISKDEVIGWDRAQLNYRIKCPYQSWGSGRELSFGALAAGANSILAGHISCLHNPFTQYPLQILTLEMLDGTPREPFIVNQMFVEMHSKFLFNPRLTGKALTEFLIAKSTVPKPTIKRKPKL